MPQRESQHLEWRESRGHHSERLWAKSWKESLDVLKSSEKGLGNAEAAIRLKEHGKNEIVEKKENKLLRIILSQILNPIVYVLLGAALISYFIGDTQTAIIILAIVVITSGIGFIQEYRSEKAVEKLKKYLTFTATAIRDGEVVELDASELVPGDVVDLSVGDRVPADLRLISAEDISIDESVLTGEHYPVEKTTDIITKEKPIPQDMKNIAFAGAMVSEGHGHGVVIATGDDTYFGKTALMLESVKDESDFQVQLKKFGNVLLRAILISAFFVFIVNVYVGHGFATSLLFAVTLAVGLVPEPLPFIVTLLLSRGASKLADKGVIVKRLSATEDLGNIDILCCDKTGTLTENKITVSDYFNIEGERDEKPLLLGMQCNSAIVHDHHFSGNPIDVALLEYGRRFPHFRVQMSKYEKVQEIPFDYERRRMSVVVMSKEMKQYFIVCKGAPEAILEVSTKAVVGGKFIPIERRRKQILKTYHELSEKGYRTIAVAIKEVRKQDRYAKTNEKDMTFIGFVTFIDPAKKSAKNTLALAKKFGVNLKILTGDGATVTKAIAGWVGFDVPNDRIIEGEALDEVLAKKDIERLERTVIFARVTPDQKFRIIKLLRSKGHVVAYLGDGVNDAPPLMEADVGISVSSGADIAKEAADVVLTKKDLHPLIDGIILGRGIFANIVKYIRCTFAGNFGNLYTVALASGFLKFIPMLPAQILLINFLSDTPLLAISTDNVDEEELRKPRKWNVGQITKNGAIFGVISTIFDFVLLYFILSASESLFQSALFLEVIFSEIFVILSLRSMKPFFLAKAPSLPLIIAIIGVAVVGVVSVLPPVADLFGFQTPPQDLIILSALVAVGYSIATEIAKYFMYRHLWVEKIGKEKESVVVSE